MLRICYTNLYFVHSLSETFAPVEDEVFDTTIEGHDESVDIDQDEYGSAVIATQWSLKYHQMKQSRVISALSLQMPSCPYQPIYMVVFVKGKGVVMHSSIPKNMLVLVWW